MRTQELLQSEIIITSSNNVLQLAMFNSDIIDSPNTEPWSCYRVVELPVGVYTNEELITVVNTALKSAKSYTSSTHESLASVDYFNGSTEIFNFKVTNEHTIVLDVNYSLSFTDYFNASFCFVYHPRGVHKLPLFSKFCWLKLNPGDPILWDYCLDSWRTYFYDTFCINCPFKNQTLTLSKKCNVRYTSNNSPNSSIMDANSSNPGILTIDQGIYEVEDFCNLLNALGSNVTFEKMRNCVHVNIINVSSISSNFSNLCNASVSSSGTLDMYFYNQNICYFKIRKYQYTSAQNQDWYTYYTDYTCYSPPISGLGYSELMLDYCELFTNSLGFIRTGINLNTFEETVENIPCSITLNTGYTDPTSEFLYAINLDAGLCSLLVDTDPVTNNNLYFYKSITLDDTILQNSFYSYFPNIIVCDSFILRQTINLNNVLVPIFNNFHYNVLKSNTPDIVTDKYVKQSLTNGFPLVNISGLKLQNLFGVSTGDSTSHDYYRQSHLVLNTRDVSMSNPSCLYKWGDDMSYLSIRFLGSEPETYFYVFGNDYFNLLTNKSFEVNSSNNKIFYKYQDHVGNSTGSDISITLPTGSYTMVSFLELLKTNGIINYTKNYANGLYTFYIEYSIAIDTGVYSFDYNESTIQNYYLWNRFFNLEFNYEGPDPSFPQLFYGWVPCIDYSCSYTICYNKDFILNYMISIDDVIDNTVYTLEIPCGNWNVPQLIRFISMLPKQHNINNESSGFDTGCEVYYDTYPSEPNNVPFRLYRYRLFSELNRIKFVFLIDDNSILKNIPVFYQSDMPMWPMSCVNLLTPVNFTSTIDFDIFCGLRTIIPGVNDICEIVKKEETFNASNTNNIVSLLKCYQTNCSNRGVQQLNSYPRTDIQESAKLVNIDYSNIGDPSSGVSNESNYSTYYSISNYNFRQGSSFVSSDSSLYYSLRPRTNYKNTSALRLGALPIPHVDLMSLNLTGVRTIDRPAVFSDTQITMYDPTVFEYSTTDETNNYTIDGKYTTYINKFTNAFTNGSSPIYSAGNKTIAPVNNDSQVSGGSTSLSLYTDNPDQFITNLQVFNKRGDINKIICIIEDPDNPGSYTTKTFEIFLWTGTTNNKTLEYTTNYFFDNFGTYNSTNNTIDISFGTSNFNIAYIDNNLYNIDTTPSLDFNSNTKSLLLAKNSKVKNSNILYTNKNEIVNLDTNDYITVIPGADEIDYLTNTGCYWFMDEPMIVVNNTGSTRRLLEAIYPQLVNFVNTGCKVLNDRIYFHNPENIKSVRFLSCAIFNKLGIVVTKESSSNSIAIDATLYLLDNSLTYDPITSSEYSLYNQSSQFFDSTYSCVFTLDQYIDPHTSNVFYCDKTTYLQLIAENYYNKSDYDIDASLLESDFSMPYFNSGAELSYFSKCCVVEYNNGETQLYSQGKTLSGSYNNTPTMLIMHTYDQFINIDFLGAYNCLKLPHIINKNFTINDNNTLSLSPGYYIFEICITFDKTYIKNTKDYANLSLILYSLNPAIKDSNNINKEYIWSNYSYQNSNTNYFTYSLYYHVCIDTVTVYTPKLYAVMQGEYDFNVNIRYVIEKVI